MIASCVASIEAEDSKNANKAVGPYTNRGGKMMAHASCSYPR